MSKKLFNNKAKMVWVIVLFILAFLMFMSRQAFASEIHLQGGYAALRGETPAIGLNLKWPGAAPNGADWEAGLILSGQSEYKGIEEPNTVSVYGMLVPHWGPFEIGLGLAHHNNDWGYSCQQTFALMFGVRWKRASLRWMHFSSGGSCKPNVGRDIPLGGLRLGWAF